MSVDGNEVQETKPLNKTSMSLVVAGPAIGIGGLLCGFLAGLIGAIL